MTFSHYIITRFNLPLSSRSIKNGLDVCSQDYLSKRIDIFERFCMPSIRQQTCQNFKWLILFDIKTPDVYKQIAAGWHNIYPNLIPCYLDVEDYGGLPSGSELVTDVDTDSSMLQITSQFVGDTIRSLEVSHPEWILTSRIDDDDALHQDWIARVQGLFKACPQQLAYDFVYTYKYVLKESIVYRYALRNGHFLTLAEPSDTEFRSVLFCNHLEMDKYFKVEHIYGRTLQTELIHSENVVNGYTDLSIRGLWSAFFNFGGKKFGYNTIEYSRLKALWMIGSLLKHKLFL